ncbi:hypothetical protein D3C71_1818590 [compost metagenome]
MPTLRETVRIPANRLRSSSATADMHWLSVKLFSIVKPVPRMSSSIANTAVGIAMAMSATMMMLYRKRNTKVLRPPHLSTTYGIMIEPIKKKNPDIASKPEMLPSSN